MKVKFRNTLIITFVAMIQALAAASCSHDEEVRTPDDILGIWSPSDSEYLEFTADYRVRKLNILYQDDKSIGEWTEDAYLYDPGYQLVIYMNGVKAYVYEVVSMDATQFTWCPVKEIDAQEIDSKDKVGHILGDIIKEAQEGFHLNPELYETFYKVSEDKFYSILEGLNILYPW